MMFPCPVCGKQESHSHSGLEEEKRVLCANIDAQERELSRLRAREHKLVEVCREAARRSESDIFERATVARLLLDALEEP